MWLFRMFLVAVLTVVAWCAFRWEEVRSPLWLALTAGGRPATMQVEGWSCEASRLGAGRVCEVHGRVSSDDGAYTDRPADLLYRGESDPQLAVGGEQRVLATMEVNGRVQVVGDPGPDSLGWAVREAGPTLHWLRIAGMVLVGLYLLDLVGSLLRPWGRGRRQVVLARSAPGCAGLLLGLGLPLVMGASTRLGGELGPPALWGAGFVLLALLMPSERWVVVDRSERKLSRGWRYLILRWTTRSVDAGEFLGVQVTREGQVATLTVRTARAGNVELLKGAAPQVDQLARQLSQAAGVSIGSGSGRSRKGRQPAQVEAPQAPARPVEPTAPREPAGDGPPLVTVVGEGASLERVAPLLGCGCLLVLAVLAALAFAGVIDPMAWLPQS